MIITNIFIILCSFVILSQSLECERTTEPKVLVKRQIDEEETTDASTTRRKILS